MFSKFSKTIKPNLFYKSVSKGFRQRLNFKETSTSQLLGYTLLGIGVGGMSLLMFRMGRGSEAKHLIATGQVVAPSVSVQRTKSTLQYFAGSVGMTAGMTALMLRSPKIVQLTYGWPFAIASFAISMFSIYKIMTIPYDDAHLAQKHFYYLLFNGAMAASLTPLIAISEMMVVRDAFLLTSGTFGGLGLIAWRSRDDAFLGMSGFLGAGLGAIATIGIANIFLQSTALFNIWLYGGLVLFTGLTLYDMKEIQIKAQRSITFDPIRQSITAYLDFINLFIRILMIMNNQKRK